MRSCKHGPARPMTGTALMLSLRWMFDAGRARDLRARAHFILCGESFIAAVEGGKIAISREAPEEVDLVLRASPEVLRVAIYGSESLSRLERRGSRRCRVRDRQLSGSSTCTVGPATSRRDRRMTELHLPHRWVDDQNEGRRARAALRAALRQFNSNSPRSIL